jgi:hypothetical protein
MAGYSGTPLAAKLGIREGCRLFVSGAPKNYVKLVTLPQGARVVRKIDGRTDVAHVFVTEKARLPSILRTSLAGIRPDAAIWVSWPKKSSKVPTDITEDTIREVALPMGLVDIKVCAVDEVWSGLKLVVRKANRSR